VTTFVPFAPADGRLGTVFAGLSVQWALPDVVAFHGEAAVFFVGAWCVLGGLIAHTYTSSVSFVWLRTLAIMRREVRLLEKIGGYYLPFPFQKSNHRSNGCLFVVLS
jgi:hypothetical protein